MIALAGGLLISVLGFLGLTLAWAAVIAAILVTITRMFAMTYGWRLPALIGNN